MPPTPAPLDPETAPSDPVEQFRLWFAHAQSAGVTQPEAMTLASAAPTGAVSARTVLLRGFDERGFVFYTNLESAKGTELDANPRAAVVFHWREQERQVRAVGPVQRVGADEATRYWNSRPRGHRVSAWASPQSQVVERTELEARVAEVEARYAGADPPLPQFWGGFVVGIVEIEFWQGRADRLHDRLRYRRDGSGHWIRERLAP